MLSGCRKDEVRASVGTGSSLRRFVPTFLVGMLFTRSFSSKAVPLLYLTTPGVFPRGGSGHSMATVSAEVEGHDFAFALFGPGSDPGSSMDMPQANGARVLLQNNHHLVPKDPDRGIVTEGFVGEDVLVVQINAGLHR